MNTTNSIVFERHAELLKAIAHPSRLEILQLLRAHELTVSQIATMSGLRQPTASQHLARLRSAGVVVSNKRGKEMYYAIRHKNFVRATDLVRSVLLEDHLGDELGKKILTLDDKKEPEVRDEICGMKLTPSSASHTYSYYGVLRYFCGKGCLNQFITKYKA